MIEWLMFGALGFLLGCLLALMLAPPLWNRAVKLTTRRLEATMPMSLIDIQADKDQLRAEFAIELRKVEVALDKAKEKAARELIEANKRRVEIQMLNTEIGTITGKLQENENANRVLQQTIKRRLPDLDSRLKAAKKALAELESVNAELRNTVASQSEALKTARSTLHSQRADIERLRVALEAGGVRGSGKVDARAVNESQRLAAELSRTREELDRARTSSEEYAFLRREMTRLAQHILAAARTQGMTVPQQRMVMEVAQAFPQFGGLETAGEQHQPEVPHYATNGGGNGAAHHEPAMAEPQMQVETAVEEYTEISTRSEEMLAPAEGAAAGEIEAEAPRGTIAQRFAARRERRRSGRASSGGSLRDRLRGLVAE
jgi:predicted  nucleic acid-binding Zn-ribbon protein